MVQRVTVTIPDELGERLNAVKDRFNVSRVCQEALASEVSRQELLMKENPTTKEVIKRLKVEKDRLYKDCENEGFKEGYKDAKQMSYPVLRHFVDNISWKCGSRRYPVLSLDPKSCPGKDPILYIEFDLEDAGDAFPALKKRDLAPNIQPGLFDADSYYKGWWHGVLKFWLEVEDELSPWAE